MPASPITAKTGGAKIKSVGQTAGQSFGTNDQLKSPRQSTPTGNRVLGK